MEDKGSKLPLTYRRKFNLKAVIKIEKYKKFKNVVQEKRCPCNVGVSANILFTNG
jgi:uncharacterized OsmC-like protein